MSDQIIGEAKDIVVSFDPDTGEGIIKQRDSEIYINSATVMGALTDLLDELYEERRIWQDRQGADAAKMSGEPEPSATRE